MTAGPDRDARPWVNVIVVAQHQNNKSGYLVGRHHGHGVVFPGGRVNVYERLSDAAAREFLEETGLKVVLGEQLHVFEVVEKRADYHKVCVLYDGEILDGEEGQAGDDLTDLRYVKIEELIDDPDASELTLRIALWLRHKEHK